MKQITCPHCGDTYPDFDVAHACSRGPYAVKLKPKMTERMRQLAEQAGLVRRGDWGMKRWEGPRSDSINDQDLEKFAELIVRECAQHALDFNNNIQHLPDKVMRGNLDRVQDYIKDRMGVEL